MGQTVMEQEELGKVVRAAWTAYVLENPERCDACAGAGELSEYCDLCSVPGDPWVVLGGCPVRHGKALCLDCDGTGEGIDSLVARTWDECDERTKEAARRMGEAVAAHVRFLDQARAHTRASELESALRGLVASQQKCLQGRCGRPATQEWEGQYFWCDEHPVLTADGKCAFADAPNTVPLRRALALLGLVRL